jgi:uncharacterized metal-binding protein YceD (DUF177 family)
MTDEADPPFSASVPTADLAARRITRFALEPDAAARAAIAGAIGAERIRKLRFEGVLQPEGKRGWRLEADLGATVVQPCVVTLAPVTTRIDRKVLRRYIDDDTPQPAEAEIPEDDTIEPLRDVIDPGAVMIEALVLALPLYPRAAGVDPAEAHASPPGATPIEAAAKPFSGLAGLRDSLAGKNESGGDRD